MPIACHKRGLGQKLELNKSKPWESAFEASAANAERWKEETETPCKELLGLERLHRGVAKAKGEASTSTAATNSALGQRLV